MRGLATGGWLLVVGALGCAGAGPDDDPVDDGDDDDVVVETDETADTDAPPDTDVAPDTDTDPPDTDVDTDALPAVPASCVEVSDAFLECPLGVAQAPLLPPVLLDAMRATDFYDEAVRSAGSLSVEGLNETIGHGSVGDLDGDGRLDLVLSGQPTATTAWRHDGALGFTPMTGLPDLPPMVHPAIVDLDRDGVEELVLVGPALGVTDADLLRELGGVVQGVPPDLSLAVTVLSRGAGAWVDVTEAWGFGPLPAACRPVPGVDTPEGFVLPLSVTAGDLNGDDWLDLIVAFPRGCALVAWTSDGAGGWSVDPDALPAVAGETGVQLVDVDEDGDLDLYVASLDDALGGDSLAAYRNDDGTWTWIPMIDAFGLSFADSPMGLLPVDLFDTSGVGLAVGGDGQFEWVWSELYGIQLALERNGVVALSTGPLGFSEPTTRWGGDTIPWSLAALHRTPTSTLLVAIAGFEHMVVPIPQHTLVWSCARGDATCAAAHELVHADRGIRDGGAVHERGLLVADLFDEDPGRPCRDLLPLPVAEQPHRVLVTRGCDPGVILTLRTAGGMPAYSARVSSRYTGARRVDQLVTPHHGFEGFGPPEVHVTTDGLVDVQIRWPDGTTSTHPAASLATGVLVQP